MQKIEYSIALMRKAEPLALNYDSEDGFHLAFSGGKDSQCLYHVAQLAGVKFKAHFSPTSVDPPQLIRFIKKNYPDCVFKKLSQSIYSCAVKKAILPTKRVRWCCQEFKEQTGAGKVTLIGIRHEESSRRAKRNEFEISGHKFSGDYEKFLTWQEEQLRKKYKNLNQDQFSYNQETQVRCIGDKDSLLVSPIIHWTERDVWDFLNGMEIGHCELYDMGYHRIGCILCPMSNYKQKLREINNFPYVKEKWIQAIMEIRRGGLSQAKRKNCGLWAGITPLRCGEMDCQQSTYSVLPNSGGQEREIAERIFDWWISGKPYSEWYAETFQQLKIEFPD